MKSIDYFLKNKLLKRNIWISKGTNSRQLAEFFSLVRPIFSGHPLIRLGGSGDGGYLIPDDLDCVDACFSAGVSEVSNFENDLAKRNIKCFLADYSVDRPAIQNDLFDFEKKYIGPTLDERFISLENWIKLKAPDACESILQMDIEDGEYPVLFDASVEILNKFRIIVIEFHRLNHLFNKDGFELIFLSFQKLAKNFEVVHIHPNNCKPPVSNGHYSIPPVMEFTFLRKDRIKKRQKNINFPHLLDMPNSENAPNFCLPPCWYQDSVIFDI
jgi:hypothetical protein